MPKFFLSQLKEKLSLACFRNNNTFFGADLALDLSSVLVPGPKRTVRICLKRFTLKIMNQRMLSQILKALCFAPILGLLFSCASTSEEVQPKVHRAANGMDNFTIEQGMPLREVQKKEFYFKHCELETRRAFTSKAEFTCNER